MNLKIVGDKNRQTLDGNSFSINEKMTLDKPSLTSSAIGSKKTSEITTDIEQETSSDRNAEHCNSKQNGQYDC